MVDFKEKNQLSAQKYGQEVVGKDMKRMIIDSNKVIGKTEDELKDKLCLLTKISNLLKKFKPRVQVYMHVDDIVILYKEEIEEEVIIILKREKLL